MAGRRKSKKIRFPMIANTSLRAVLGSSEAWRALLQTLRTRIFLSLSDDASAKIASELCGQVAKIKGSYTISETSKRAGVSPLSGRAGGSGGGSIGATKSFQERREAVFHPRDFALLGNCQAICLPLGYPFNRTGCRLRRWITLVLARTIRGPWASSRPGSAPMRTVLDYLEWL